MARYVNILRRLDTKFKVVTDIAFVSKIKVKCDKV